MQIEKENNLHEALFIKFLFNNPPNSQDALRPQCMYSQAWSEPKAQKEKPCKP